MDLKFKVYVEVKFEDETIDRKYGVMQRTKLKLNECRLALTASENIEHSQYLDEQGYYNKQGTEVITNVLIEGLLTNLHASHDRGYWDSAEHLRHIIAELEKGFVRTGCNITTA